MGTRVFCRSVVGRWQNNFFYPKISSPNNGWGEGTKDGALPARDDRQTTTCKRERVQNSFHRL